MSKVDYRFRVETDTTTVEMTPLYGSDLSKEVEREANQVFFREKLSGKLTFVRGDFDLIDATSFGHEFVVHIDRKPRNQPWELDWWVGTFTKTDCEFDEDNKTVEAEIEPLDRYKKVMDAMDKEFDLIEAAPETAEVLLKVQPLVQVYILGSNVVTNIMSGVHWEQPIQDPTILQDPLLSLKLVNDYFFATQLTMAYIPGTTANGGTLNPDVSGSYNYPQYDRADGRYQFITVGAANFPGLGSQPTDDPQGNAESMFVVSSVPLDEWDDFLSIWQAGNGNQFEYIGSQPQPGTSNFQMHFRGLNGDSAPSSGTLTHVSGAVNTGTITYTAYQNNWLFWRNALYDQNPPIPLIQRYVYVAQYAFGSAAGTGTHNHSGEPMRSLDDPDSQVRLFSAAMYVRYLTNETVVNGNNTQPIPENDIVTSSSRYERVIGLLYDAFIPYDGNSATPDRWGRYASNAVNFAGNYFTQFIAAPSLGIGQTYPIAKSEWTEWSVWFYYTSGLRILQENGGTQYTLKNAMKFGDSINSLLKLIDPTVTHLEDQDHSQFLYGSNSIRGSVKYPLISPKSNVIVGEYDKPAQKARVRLADFLNFCRDFYQLAWYIDDNNRLVLEHIQFFENGMTYSGTDVDLDLTTLIEPKNEKPWAYRTKKYKFDKVEMPEQIRHKWMDDSSEPFEGFPIEVLSPYVQKGNLSEKNLSLFTSDVDLIHANSDQIAQDGFVFMEAIINVDGEFELPFVTITLTYPLEYKIQNGYAAMVYAHNQYWRYLLPASSVEMNLDAITALSVKKNRVQEIDYPSPVEPDPMKLITTSLGDGRVTKMTINLSSGAVKITLKHGTE